MIHSAAARNFINCALIEKLRLHTQLLQHPYMLIPNNITVMTKFPVVLGFPWMYTHDPQISWADPTDRPTVSHIVFNILLS